MNFVKITVLIAMFFLLSPNILFRLPGDKYVSALLHGALFAMLWYVSYTLNPVLEGIESKSTRCANLDKNLLNQKLTKDQRNHIIKQMKEQKCGSKK